VNQKSEMHNYLRFFICVVLCCVVLSCLNVVDEERVVPCLYCL